MARSSRLTLRLTPDEKYIIGRAAALSGSSTTDFVRSTMLAAAGEAVRTHEVIELTTEGSAAFVKALTDPPEPNENLRALAREQGMIARGRSEEDKELAGELEAAMVLRHERAVKALQEATGGDPERYCMLSEVERMVEEGAKAEEKDPAYYMGLPYTVEVEHDPGSEWPWFAKVFELPGCMTSAQTLEELGSMIEDAKRGWIEDALEHGDPVPEPRSAE